MITTQKIKAQSFYQYPKTMSSYHIQDIIEETREKILAKTNIHKPQTNTIEHVLHIHKKDIQQCLTAERKEKRNTNETNVKQWRQKIQAETTLSIAKRHNHKHGKIDNLTYTIIYDFLNMAYLLAPTQYSHIHSKYNKKDIQTMELIVKKLLYLFDNNLNNVSKFIIYALEDTANKVKDIDMNVTDKKTMEKHEVVDFSKIHAYIETLDQKDVLNIRSTPTDIAYHVIYPHIIIEHSFYTGLNKKGYLPLSEITEYLRDKI